MSRSSVNIIFSLLFICLILVIFSLLKSNSKKHSKLSNTKTIKEYLENEEIDLAINYIDSLFENSPDDINILINRAEVYYNINETKVAKESWEKCLELDNNNIECAEKLVELYCTVGDINCISSIDYLLNINPKNLTALNFKAKLEKDLGNIDNAIKLYKQVLEIDKENIECD